MKKSILFILFCFVFCSLSLAQNTQSFNFILFIDGRITDFSSVDFDFVTVDTWTHKQDTVKCRYELGNLEIEEDDLEKIKKADSIYAHIEYKTYSKNYTHAYEYEYDIKCYKRFYQLRYIIFEIYNLDKYGKKYDYRYLGNDRRCYVFGGCMRKKKNIKFSNRLKAL